MTKIADVLTLGSLFFPNQNFFKLNISFCGEIKTSHTIRPGGFSYAEFIPLLQSDWVLTKKNLYPAAQLINPFLKKYLPSAV